MFSVANCVFAMDFDGWGWRSFKKKQAQFCAIIRNGASATVYNQETFRSFTEIRSLQSLRRSFFHGETRITAALNKFFPARQHSDLISPRTNKVGILFSAVVALQLVPPFSELLTFSSFFPFPLYLHDIFSNASTRVSLFARIRCLPLTPPLFAVPWKSMEMLGVTVT